jgi:hypothetical protein
MAEFLGAVVVILFFGGIIAVATAYKKLTKGGISGAIDRATTKKERAKQSELLHKQFIYRTTKSEAELRNSICSYLWGGNNAFTEIRLVEDQPGYMRLGYSATKVSVKLNLNNFEAVVMFSERDSVLIFQIETWRYIGDKTVGDAVAVNFDEMIRLKFRIDEAVKAVDPNVVVTVQEMQ